MKCSDVHKLIKPYVENSLDLNDTERLIEHITECKDCYEELEIYYILVNVLKKIDSADNSEVFNVKKELDIKLENSRKHIYFYNSLKNYMRAVFIVSNVALAAAIINFAVSLIAEIF